MRRQCSAGNRRCTVSDARSSVTHATAPAPDTRWASSTLTATGCACRRTDGEIRARLHLSRYSPLNANHRPAQVVTRVGALRSELPHQTVGMHVHTGGGEQGRRSLVSAASTTWVTASWMTAGWPAESSRSPTRRPSARTRASAARSGYPAAALMKGQPHSPAVEPPGRRSAVALGALRWAMSFAPTGSLIGGV
jgi:hypothetical protein